MQPFVLKSTIGGKFFKIAKLFGIYNHAGSTVPPDQKPIGHTKKTKIPFLTELHINLLELNIK